jgi:SAM-dependent methyltransferase
MELAPGVVTPGWFDLRSLPSQLPMPASLAGLRCLDIGTFEGFWAFEMESRGAAEVVAIDILDPRAWDWPRASTAEVLAALERRKRGGRGFEVAHSAFGSAVTRRELSVYDLDAADVGTFDFVYLGSLILHLRDPVRALERVHDVLRPGGRLLVVDAVDMEMTMLHPRRPVATLDGRGRPWWWKCNAAALVRLVEVAGLTLVEAPRRVFMQPGAGQQLPGFRPRHLLSPLGREGLLTRWKGEPHLALLGVAGS